MTAIDSLPDGPVLVVTAHPDDVDFGMSGTLARWAGAGAEIAYCVVTDGDAGGFDADAPREEVAALRRREQQAAAEVVGAASVCFLGYPDGRVEATLELRRDLSRLIRRIRPAVVLTQSPSRDLDRIYASHPDHLAVGEATLCAVYPDARNPFAHPELVGEEDLAPHVVTEVWLSGGPEVDRFVDITDTFDRKLAALACHRSQISHRDPTEFATMIRGWSERLAADAGLPQGRLAEGFRRVVTG